MHVMVFLNGVYSDVRYRVCSFVQSVKADLTPQFP